LGVKAVIETNESMNGRSPWDAGWLGDSVGNAATESLGGYMETPAYAARGEIGRLGPQPSLSPPQQMRSISPSPYSGMSPDRTISPYPPSPYDSPGTASWNSPQLGTIAQELYGGSSPFAETVRSERYAETCNSKMARQNYGTDPYDSFGGGGALDYFHPHDLSDVMSSGFPYSNLFELPGCHIPKKPLEIHRRKMNPGGLTWEIGGFRDRDSDPGRNAPQLKRWRLGETANIDIAPRPNSKRWNVAC